MIDSYNLEALIRNKKTYNPAWKEEYKRSSVRFLRQLAKELNLMPNDYDIRFNPGGIAVYGEAILHHKNFYIMIIPDSFSPNQHILYRTCKGLKDYSGGINQYTTFYQLDVLLEFCKKQLEK